METIVKNIPVATGKVNKSNAQFSPKVIEEKLSEIEALQKKLTDAKDAVKKAKEVEREAKKAAKAAKAAKDSYNRMTAMCEALKTSQSKKREDVCKLADQLYIEKSGEAANVVKTSRYYGYAVDAKRVFSPEVEK